MTNLKDGVLYNDENCIYLKGDSKTIGSKKIIIDSDTGNAGIMRMTAEDVWRADSFEFGPDTVWVGLSVGLAGIGHHLATESRSDNHLHFFAHSEYDGEASTVDTRMMNAVSYTAAAPYQPDFSGEWTGTTLDFTMASPAHILVSAIQYKTGVTAATKPIRIRIYKGTDDTGGILFNQQYPASQFPASSDVIAEYAGRVEFEDGVTYYVKYTSDEDFSLKTNAAVTMPYFTGDTSYLREDNLLQTKPWVSGDSWTADDYFIDSRKIYICNTTGVQTGTFASNSDKWDSVGISHDDYWTKTDSILQNASGVDSFTFNDGSQNRIKVSALDTELRSSNGLSTIALYDAQYQLTITGGTKINIHSGATQLTGPGGRNLLMDTSSINLNDGTNDRFLIDTTKFEYVDAAGVGRVLVDSDDITLVSANGSSLISMDNTQLTHLTSAGTRLNIDGTNSQLLSPNPVLYGMEVSNSGTNLTDFNFNRLQIDGTRSKLVAPNGDEEIDITNTGITIHDGARARVEAITSFTKLTSETGEAVVTLGGADFTFNDGTYDRLKITSNDISLIGHLDNAMLNVSETGMGYTDGDLVSRLLINSTLTRLNSPNNGYQLDIEETSCIIDDSVKDRIIINESYTAIHDEHTTGGGYLYLAAKELTFVDGTEARIEVTGVATRIISPDGANKAIVTDTEFEVNDGTISRILANASSTKIYGSTAQERFTAGGAGGGGPTKIWSEDGQYGIRIDSSGIDFTRNGGSSWNNQYT